MTNNEKKARFYRKVISFTLAIILMFALGAWKAGSLYLKPSDLHTDNCSLSAVENDQKDVLSDTHDTSLDWNKTLGNERAYVAINGNAPNFTKDETTTTSFERYSPRDKLNRCGVAMACVGKDIMPTEKRGPIGMVKPSGWHTIRYNGVVEGNYLYNRCHLIAFELAGENANEDNLITGTRFMNVQGMLPFENKVAQYVKRTGNHVMYRVTPHFEGDNLIASCVQIEAYSVEDKGKGISFNVICPNVQPQIKIDYLTGESNLVNEE